MTAKTDAVLKIVGVGVKATGQFQSSSVDPTSPSGPTRIRANDIIRGTDGLAYVATSVGNPDQQIESSVNLSSVGTTATCVTLAAHTMVTGTIIAMFGADQAEYNVAAEAVTVIDEFTFTYPFPGSATSPATHGGAGFFPRWQRVRVFVESVGVGSNQNKQNDTLMNIESPRGEMDSTGRLIEPLIGGINREDDPNASFFDLQIDAGGDILRDQSFDTALLMSIFEEVRAAAREVLAPQLRRGWIGNESTPNFEQGSKAWTFEQERITGSILAELGQVVRNGLQWFIDDDLLLNVIVEQPLLLAGRVGVFVNLHRDGSPVERRFFELWDNTGKA